MRDVSTPSRDPRTRILDWDAAAGWRRRAAAEHRSVVFTNGVFDLLHPGHVDLLVAARAAGDALIVGINSDASVRRLGKGPERPVRTAPERAYVLAALACVDAVVVFDQDTPQELVALLIPDVIVKGGDYTPETVVGGDIVRKHGGRVIIVPLTDGHSTTSTIARLRAP